MSIEAMKQALEADTEGASMSEQPTALRLADAIDTRKHTYGDVDDAAAELRRLHAENEDHIQQLRKEQLEVERLHSVNAQLLEALEQIIDLPEDSRIHYKVARRAIAAAKEKS